VITLIAGFFACAAIVQAHELQETTASITVRDRSVEVVVNLDLIGWLEHMRGGDAGDAHAGLPIAEPQIAAGLLAKAKEQLTGVMLDADDARVPLQTGRFPTPMDVMAAAGSRGHGEAARGVIVLHGTLPEAGEEMLSLTLPKAMGPVVVNLSRPQTQWIAPATTARFVDSKGTTTAAATTSQRPGGIVAAALCLALISLAASVYVIRKSGRASG
jgi:hypothetical protein